MQQSPRPVESLRRPHQKTLDDHDLNQSVDNSETSKERRFDQ